MYLIYCVKWIDFPYSFIRIGSPNKIFVKYLYIYFCCQFVFIIESPPFLQTFSILLILIIFYLFHYIISKAKLFYGKRVQNFLLTEQVISSKKLFPCYINIFTEISCSLQFVNFFLFYCCVNNIKRLLVIVLSFNQVLYCWSMKPLKLKIKFIMFCIFFPRDQSIASVHCIGSKTENKKNNNDAIWKFYAKVRN